MPNIPVLGLDISKRRTGWAADRLESDIPLFGSYGIPDLQNEHGKIGARFRRWLHDTIETLPVRPQLIVFEAPLQLIGKGNEQYPTNQDSVRKIWGLEWTADMVAAELGIVCREAAIPTVKKFFAGNGHAEKKHMVARCEQLGWGKPNEDEADGCGVWAYGKSIMNPGWAASGTPLFSSLKARVA